MFNKKGQLTIFIIFAILIVVGTLLFFTFRERINFNKLSPEAESIFSFVEQCIKEEGEKSIYEIGTKGGYYLPNNFSTKTKVPYYYANKKKYMPSKEKIENEISLSLTNNLINCTKNFESFSEFDIKQENISPHVKISEEKISFNVNYPIRISYGENVDIIKEFNNIEIPSNLGVIYNSISKIIEEQLKTNKICLNCILEESLKNDFYVDLADYENETVIFIIQDKNNKLNNKSFDFVFASKY